MKKSLVLLLFILFISKSYSQNPVNFGLKLGASISNLTYMDGTAKPTVGIVGGAYLRLNLRKRRPVNLTNVYFQPEISLTQRGGKSYNDKTFYSYKHTYNYIDVPVLLGIKVLNIFRIAAGPNFHYLLFVNNKTTDAKGEDTRDTNKKGLTDASLGYQLTLGLEVKRFGINYRYDSDITSLFTADVPRSKTSQIIITFEIR